MNKRSTKFYRKNEAEVMRRLGFRPTKKQKKGRDNLSGKKGMKIKNRKPMSQETRKRISETMKKKLLS